MAGAVKYIDCFFQLRRPEWAPDYGPDEFVPRWGATIAGARKFLIAYNINLLSTKEQAHRIALNIREQGRGPKEPGRLKNVQGLGWWYEEGKIAQISTNLTDLDVTTLHQVYEEAAKDALELRLPIIGSEVVGLVPLKPVLQAADYFIQKENLFVLEEEQKIQLVSFKSFAFPLELKLKLKKFGRIVSAILRFQTPSLAVEIFNRRPRPLFLN